MLQNKTADELKEELMAMVKDLRNEAVYCLGRYDHYKTLDVPGLVYYFKGRLLEIKSMHNGLVLTLGLGADQWLKYDSVEVKDVKKAMKEIEAL